jgi:hypothetical protein
MVSRVLTLFSALGRLPIVAGSLEGPVIKLARAESQFHVLQQQIEAIWHPEEPWPVRPEAHRGGLEYRFYLGELPGIEPAWALMAGEIMFNLRSALDHLVWELHVRHYRGRSIPPKVEIASQFPIFDTADKWRERGRRRIKPLSKRDQRAIHFLQPYVRRNDKWSRTRRALNDLNELHNIDKHRQLHLVAGTQRHAGAPYRPKQFGFDFQPVFGPVESHCHIDTWTFTEPPPELKDHEGAYLEVVLEQPPYERNLVMLLSDLIGGVTTVLQKFGGHFPPLPDVWRSGRLRLRAMQSR